MLSYSKALMLTIFVQMLFNSIKTLFTKYEFYILTKIILKADLRANDNLGNYCSLNFSANQELMLMETTNERDSFKFSILAV